MLRRANFNYIISLVHVRINNSSPNVISFPNTRNRHYLYSRWLISKNFAQSPWNRSLEFIVEPSTIEISSRMFMRKLLNFFLTCAQFYGAISLKRIHE